MEDIYKNLKAATDAVIEAQGKSEEDAIFVLSTAGENMTYNAWNGTGYALAALLFQAMKDDRKLYKVMKCAMICYEEEEMEKECDA